MKKETIEIKRFNKTPFNYMVSHSPEEGDILDNIVEWSRNKNITIYKHRTYSKYENISETDFYQPKVSPELNIPYCDLVFYCDIYYQEK